MTLLADSKRVRVVGDHVELAASAWMEAVDRAERTNSDEDWVRADQLYRAWKRADRVDRPGERS